MSGEGRPESDTERVARAVRGASVRSVVLWLAAGSLLAFLAVCGAGSAAVGSALRRIERQGIAERVTRTRLLLEREAETRASTVREYAWWTDTWEFIDSPHTPQASRFLRDNFLDWIPGHYGDQLIAIWSLDRRRVFVWTDSVARGAEAAFETPRHFDFIASARAAAGLVATPRGLFFGAFSVVVRTDDQNATGPWHGYVAFARPVTDESYAVWSAALQERLVLRPVAGEATLLGDSAASRRTAGGDSVETRFVVRGLFGEPVAVATITGSRSFVAGLRFWILSVLGSAALVGIVAISLLWLVGHRALVLPLESTVLALERMRVAGGPSSLPMPAKAREWAVFVGAFNDTVAALHASEERYRALFQQAADALFVLEEPGRVIVDANPAAERLTDCSRDAMIGRSLADFLVPPPYATGSPGTLLLTRGGRPAATVEMVVGNIQAGARRVTLASVRDLTEREALEEQLRQAQKMEVLGRLAGGIAHDFNNLLGAVLVSASSLRSEVEADHPAQQSIQSIERAAHRAAELTRQLLSFARREGVRREPVAIRELVNGVRALCLRTFGHSLELVAKVDGEGLTVLGDAGQLEQALLNLCLNARDAMPDGGTLTLQAASADVPEAGPRPVAGLAAGRYVVISVIDTGVGIQPEALPRMFEPFFTTKERGKGTGLGLATAYGIVRGHGGMIGVRSEVGRGSHFDIYLPQSRVAVASQVQAPGGALPGGSETVLLVDDEEELRHTVSRSLVRLGYSVILAANGREAVEKFAQHADEIHLVLLDLLMPEMSGVEAFHAIRALRPAARVLVFTGFASGDEIQQLIASGAEGVLPKPFEIAELASKLRQVLDRAAEPAGSP